MPETIGALILSSIAAVEAEAIVATTAGKLLANVIGTAVIVGGSLAVQQLLPGQQPKQAAVEGQIETRQNVPPRFRYYGTVLVSGALAFEEVKLNVDDDAILYRVLLLNHGEIDGFVAHYLGDQEVLLDPSGFVLDAYTSEDGETHYVQILTRNGSPDQTAFEILVAEFPSIWTTAHRLRGITAVQVNARQPADQAQFMTVFRGGEPPQYRGLLFASKVWDPRESGQNKDIAATWQWSDNPILCLLDFHRHPDGMGLAPLDATLFTPAALAEDWIPAADLCDELVTKKDGSAERRYRCSGGYALPISAPKDVIAALLAVCDGQLYQRSDGAIGVRVGRDVSAVISIDERGVLGYDAMRRGENVFLAANEITAKIVSPDHDYQEIEVQAWRNEDDITERGQVLSRAIDISWCPSHSQARRLMKIAYHRLNPRWQGAIINSLLGLQGYGQRFVTLAIGELGIDETFEVGTFEFDVMAATVRMGVASFAADAYAWNPAVEEGDPPPVPERSPDGGTTSLEISVAGGVISAAFDGLTGSIPEALYKASAAATWSLMTITDDTPPSFFAVTPILPAGTYDVRVRSITAGSPPTSWVYERNIPVT